ncbi:MAG TPA: FMN reductase [Candidatus Limnocylindrales bacterium]|nr:FMN reductase [Candidatus Limnocylindrales bacterium]
MEGRRSLVVVAAGLRQPSSTRLLADRLAAATERHLLDAGLAADVETLELRDHAHDLVNHLLTGFPSPRLQAAIDAVAGADGLIAVTPVFSASYSGVFKVFVDVLERDGLAGKPVLLGATGGTARHSLVLEHAMRPLFAYFGAASVPTAVYAASEDWGPAGVASDSGLVARIDRAARELATAMAGRPAASDRAARNAFDDPVPFETLLAEVDPRTERD